MELKTIMSSSKGNCYVITDEGRSLIIEAGVSAKKMNGIDFSIVDGCLISHEHSDHGKGAKGLIKRSSLDVYASKGTLDALELPKHRSVVIESLKQFNIKDWTILPFDTQHDAKEPLGFFIESPSGKRILFATDTYYIKYKFPRITHLMIECNYSKEILDENYHNKTIQAFRYKRVIASHFELGNVKSFIKSNDMSELEQVMLLHLSNENANGDLFKKEIQAVTGTPVYIAKGE